MKEMKKARPAGGTAEQATETAASVAAISNEYFSITAADGQAGKIFSLLMEGEQNALSAADLVQLAGYKNQRSMRVAIDHEREIGLPVLASENGYFKPSPGPAGVAEVKRFLRRQDARAASNRRTTHLIRVQLREIERGPLPGQQNLFDGGGDDG